MLLLLVYSTFCDTFSSNKGANFDPISIISIIAVIWLIYPLFLGICFLLGTNFKFDRPDVVSICYCGSTKTLSLGIPLIGLIYGKDPNVALYSLPLLIYHATQLFIGGWAVGRLRAWVMLGKATECELDQIELSSAEIENRVEGNSPSA
jgi:sodium/bile acid cotransporter 7